MGRRGSRTLAINFWSRGDGQASPGFTFASWTQQAFLPQWTHAYGFRLHQIHHFMCDFTLICAYFLLLFATCMLSWKNRWQPSSTSSSSELELLAAASRLKKAESSQKHTPQQQRVVEWKLPVRQRRFSLDTKSSASKRRSSVGSAVRF